MNKDIAQMIAMTAARCSKEIGDLAILVKEHCSADDRQALSDAIAGAVFELRNGLMNKVFELVPELEGEFDSRTEKYARSFY